MATLKEVESNVRISIPWLAREVRRRAPWNPHHRHRLLLDCAPSALHQPRWGYGRPPHRRIFELMAAHHERYASELQTLLPFREDLLRIPLHAGSEEELCWINAWLPGLDIITLYGYVRRHAPRGTWRSGSGNSTMVAHMARTDGNAPAEITSIDPLPRAPILTATATARSGPRWAWSSQRLHELQRGTWCSSMARIGCGFRYDGLLFGDELPRASSSGSTTSCGRTTTSPSGRSTGSQSSTCSVRTSWPKLLGSCPFWHRTMRATNPKRRGFWSRIGASFPVWLRRESYPGSRSLNQVFSFEPGGLLVEPLHFQFRFNAFSRAVSH